ncbi:MAG: Ni/Fe hydrogenase subunit alpha [Deltaproteobacteria bacterium]|nr:Ni/Fe hydrogenase subunit alpha [Deltaproteobacteria bacterium]|tara:strand:+ start:12376 stop:13701 length:1326 start_codon:yes stop_codon:yes gene_type:complete
MTDTRTIKVDVLARVEGEGSLYLKVEGDEVKEARLKIFEPPRFFEAFLRGRDFHEAPDITARICGICPVAYQMSACHAMEQIFGVDIDQTIRELRRLLYCGEWIESHVLHVYMLHAPDFMGYQSAIEMAADHASIVERGLRLKKAGNQLMTLLGGREVHPINVKVGGFYKAPSKADVKTLLEELKWARDAAEETVRWVAQFDMPTFEKDYAFVALHHPDEYPLNEGRLISNRGLDIPIDDFFEHFEESHVAHSNALHASHKEYGAYFVGPIARYALNYQQLSAYTRAVAADIGFDRVCRNPFESIVIRSLETLYACDEAIRIMEQYEEPLSPCAPLDVKAGVGFGCTEAPRGICLHRYEVDEEGAIVDARIVPPTSQNQKSIEDDLMQFASAHIELSDDDLTWQCEQAIRNYDPCISCATHFLKLDVERLPAPKEDEDATE